MINMFRVQKVKEHKYVKYTCSMETVQQNGRFTLLSSTFLSNIFYSLWMHIKYFFEPADIYSESADFYFFPSLKNLL